MISARLRLHYADGKIADRILREGAYVVGREAGDIVLLDPAVSGRHAELVVTAEGVFIRDLDSTNGTWDANGFRITDPCPLAPNRPVRLGACHLVLAETKACTTPVAWPSLPTDTPSSPYDWARLRGH